MEFEELSQVVMLKEESLGMADAQQERAKTGSKISISLTLLLLLSCSFCYVVGAPSRSALLGLRLKSSLDAKTASNNNSQPAGDIGKLIELIPCISSKEGCTDLESASSCSRLSLGSAGDSLLCDPLENLDGGKNSIRGSARALDAGELTALVAKLAAKPRQRRQAAQVWSREPYESNSELAPEELEALGVGFTGSSSSGDSNWRPEIERGVRADRSAGSPLELDACGEGGRTSFYIYDSLGNKRLALGCAQTADSVKIKLADEEPVGIRALEANQMGVISMAGGAEFQAQLKRQWPGAGLLSANSAEVYKSSRRNLTRGQPEAEPARFSRAGSVYAAALERAVAMEAGSQGRGLDGAWAGPGPAEPEAAGPFECAMRRYKYKATNRDAAGNSCSGEVSATICYGHCDTGEIADWLYPHKKAIHKACVHGGRALRRARLTNCSEGASARLAEYRWAEATSCVCQRCNSDDTTCLSSPARLSSRSQLDAEERGGRALGQR